MAGLLKYLELNNASYEILGKTWYGICSASGTTRTKSVAVDGFSTPDLIEGVRVVVSFNYGQLYNGIPQLKVGGSGARDIRAGNGYAQYREWNAGAMLAFVYHNGNWCIENGEHADTTYFGKTKLSNTIANDDTTALTPKAVYDANFAHSSDIPTKVSDLNNDSGFITGGDIPSKTSDLTNDSGFITDADLPTDVSDLNNDAGYITASALPTDVSDLNNDAGYITSSALPTSVSQLTNDSGYITLADLPIYNGSVT